MNLNQLKIATKLWSFIALTVLAIATVAAESLREPSNQRATAVAVFKVR